MTLQDRFEGLQTILQRCGDSGCLFLSLCSIIEEVNQHPVDLIDVIRFSMSKGWLNANFYVLDSLSILCHYTGKSWSRRETPNLPYVGERDYTIAIWHNDRTGFTHYRRRGYDSLASSVTVKEGYLRSYYTYTWS